MQIIKSFREIIFSRWILYSSLLLIGLASQLNWQSPLLYLAGDSKQYLECASNLMDFLRGDDRISQGHVVRTPGFPIILYVSEWIGAGELRSGLLLFHFLIASVAMLYAAFALSEYLHPLITGVTFICLYRLCADIFSAIMTEWTAIALLMLIFVASVRLIQTGKVKYCHSLSLFCCAIVLIKPIFVGLVVLPFMLGYSKGLLSIRNFFFSVSIVSPIACLVVINSSRFSTPIFSPAGSLSLFGLTASIAKAEYSPNDSLMQRTFLEYVNSRSLQPDRSEWSNLSLLSADQIFHTASYNYQIAIDAKQNLDVSWASLLQLTKHYNSRVIQNNLYEYFRFGFSGLLSLKRSLVYILAIVVLSIYLVGSKGLGMLPLGLGSVVILLIHLYNISLVSFAGIIHLRYYNVTFFPLIIVTLLLLSAALKHVWNECRT